MGGKVMEAKIMARRQISLRRFVNRTFDARLVHSSWRMAAVDVALIRTFQSLREWSLDLTTQCVNARLQFGEFLMTCRLGCGKAGAVSFSILFAVMLRGLWLRYASLPET
jgi:hypothetical protein